MKHDETTLYLGTAYIILAIISLTIDIPQRVINSVSVAALLFSLSQILTLISSSKIKDKSIVNIIKDEDEQHFAMRWIEEIFRVKEERAKSNVSVWSIISTLFKCMAVVIIIVGPFYDVYSILLSNAKIGTFCTIVSLGIMFISFFAEGRRKAEQTYEEEREIIKCYGYSIHSVLNEVVQLSKDVGACKDSMAMETDDKI